jgi:riboflavin kinase/FMN adenylyltransferase
VERLARVPPVVFHGSDAYTAAPDRPVVTVGNFDGVHRGHAALIGRVVRLARERGAPACVLTFDPSPVEVLRPDRPARRLQGLPEKLASLGALGVDHVVVEAFDQAYSTHDARWFATEVIGRRLGAGALVLGHDFRFGRGRGGGSEDLRSWLPIPVEEVRATLDGETPVSSSRIRAALDVGDVATAAALLGRPHRVTGTVVTGDKRGRTIGFPTANVSVDPRILLPAAGVYAVRLDGRAGVCNLGLRPTFQGSALRLEVHVFDFDGDLYGAAVCVDFVARLRGERAFPSVEALVAQIRADADAARALLA